MKIKVLLLTGLLIAGLAASLALAKGPEKQVSSATTTTAPESKPKCDQVELKGTATAGGVTFTVTKANKRGRNLVGTAVTLVVPANAKVKAKACTAAGGALTLRDLHVKAAPAKS